MFFSPARFLLYALYAVVASRCGMYDVGNDVYADDRGV